MPTEILIFSRKNGRALRTYGVNRSEHIMKFFFICIVVVLSCGYCASGELEIYPRLRFNFNDDRKFRLKKSEKPEFRKTYRLPFPLEEISDREPFYNPGDGNLAERLDQLKKFEEVIDFERIKLMQQRHKANPERTLKDVLQLEDNRIFKPSNLLEEARVYAIDDDIKLDLDDNDEEIDSDEERNDILGIPLRANVGVNRFINPAVDETEGVYGKSLPIGLSADVQLSSEEMSSNRPEQKTRINTTRIPIRASAETDLSHGKPSLTEESAEDDKDETTRRFTGLRIMDDPSEFAYVPSDPRFYRKAGEEGLDDTETSEPISQDLRSSNDAVSVTYRNEQKNPQLKVALPEEDSTEVTQLFGEADVVAMKPSVGDMDSAGVYVIAIVAGISAAATVGLIAVGIGWYNLQKHVKNASDVEYPAYGVTGPNKDLSPSGDRRLAQSAQMYHYQHQKQQIIAMESAQPSFAISRAQPGERQGSISDADSEEENEEGDYTVYECPGLAPTGEMEVKNPLFQDDPTPAQTPAAKNNANEKK